MKNNRWSNFSRTEIEVLLDALLELSNYDIPMDKELEDRMNNALILLTEEISDNMYN